MKRNRIPTYMTPQDFQKLAERQPNLEGNWIYQVTKTVICEISDNMYPKFDIYEELPIWFLTFQEAETYIKELVAHTEKKDKELIYRFQITQYPLGCPAEHGAQWIYDNEGQLIDYTITTWIGDALYTTFFGRAESRNRFRRGDIVEITSGDEVTLALLLENPPSPELCWQLYQRCLNGDDDGSMPYFLDASDDCCYLIDGPGHEYHSHVSPLLIMKPRFPIPKEIEKEMKGWLKQLDEQKPNEQNA